LSPTGTPESKSFSPDVLSIYRHVDIAAYRDRSGVDRLARGPGFASAVSRQGGPKPKNAFRRVQNLRAFTRRRRIDPILFRPSQRFRTVSPSTHPRPYVRQATDFLLASALFWSPSDFWSTGEEDARCVEPTSATHTNYVHPHFARSRLTPRIAPRGRPPENKAPDDLIEGPSVSRHPWPLRRTVPSCWFRPLFPRGLETRTWAFSSHGTKATRPLTPLSRPLGYILSASSSFPDVACFFVFATRPRFYGLEWIGGCGDRLARRRAASVKRERPFRTGMPSIDRDPS